MKSLLTFCLMALICGVGLGAVLGYYDARPWAFHVSADAAPRDQGSGQAADSPRAEVNEPIFEFGSMERGTFKRHTFEVSNTGQADLELTFVSNTCKCTAIEINDRLVDAGDVTSIAPGESCQIALEWEAKQPAGPFRHGASFQTNDPGRSRFTLDVEGDVVESTTLSPSYLHFGSMRAGEPAEASLHVMSFLEDEVHIADYEIVGGEDIASRVQIQIEEVETSELPNPKALAGVKVSAHLDTLGMVGSVRGTLQLSTNLQRAERLVVPISALVRGDISVFGKFFNRDASLLKLDAVSSSAGERVELTVNVRGDQAQATELSVARVDPPELQVSIGERKRLGDALVSFPLVVSIPQGTRPMVRIGEDDELGGDGEGEIVLSSTLPTTPEVRLRVRLVVKP